MKKLLLALALLLAPSLGFAQCNGVFPANTVCGNPTGSANTPRSVAPTAFQGSAGGTNGQIQYNNSGALGGLTTLNNSYLTSGSANTLKGSVNGTTTSDLAIASCSALYTFTQWITGTGWQCGLIPILPTRTIAASLNLTAFTSVQTQGYATAGDGGDGIYVKVGSGGNCPFTDSGGQIWSLITLHPFNVMSCGAKLDGSTDDHTAFQAALTAAGALPDPGAGSPSGAVTCPAGRAMSLASGVDIDNPITIDCQSVILYTGASGSVFSVGASVGRNFPQNYQIRLRGIDCTAGGNTAYGVHLYQMNFSMMEVDVIQNCNAALFYCDGTGGTHSAQTILHNTFNLGQLVNGGGYGILLDSLDAATSSCEANVWNVQDAYANNINLQVDLSPHLASTSNTFNIQSSDPAVTTNAVIRGSYNIFNFGYLNGTASITSGTYNTLVVGNPAATGATISNSGGATNKCWIAGSNPGTC